MDRFLIRYINRYVDMTYSTIFDDIDKPRKKRRRRKKVEKQSNLYKKQLLECQSKFNKNKYIIF